MQPLIDRLLANDLADLEGLEIKGSLPISEALANELVSNYMDDLYGETASASRGSTPESAYLALLKRLKPSLFKISFETGKATVNFELKR